MGRDRLSIAEILLMQTWLDNQPYSSGAKLLLFKKSHSCVKQSTVIGCHVVAKRTVTFA